MSERIKERVYKYILLNPGCSQKDIATSECIGNQSTASALYSLKIDRKIKCVRPARPKGRPGRMGNMYYPLAENSDESNNGSDKGFTSETLQSL